MKFFWQTVRNALQNFLWIAMFIVLWPVEDKIWLRVPLAFGAAVLLGVVQTLFKKYDK